MSDYRTEAPEILRDFLSYHETIKAHSQRTVDEYYLDLRNFFRYMKQIRDPDLADKSLKSVLWTWIWNLLAASSCRISTVT